MINICKKVDVDVCRYLGIYQLPCYTVARLHECIILAKLSTVLFVFLCLCLLFSLFFDGINDGLIGLIMQEIWQPCPITLYVALQNKTSYDINKRLKLHNFTISYWWH